MAAFGNNKRAVESILVASGDQGLVNMTADAAALPGGGTRSGASGDIPLMSTVNTGFVNLNDGQLGVFCADHAGVRGMNVALLSTDTFATAPSIYIAQGTSTSQSPGVGPYPLTNNRPYESTGVILGRNHIIASGRAAAYHTYSVWNVGKTVAIAPLDLADYALNITYRGQALDTESLKDSYATDTVDFTTPDYTAFSATITNAKDHFIQNFVYQINRNSKAFWGVSSIWNSNEPVVGFAVSPKTASNTTDIHATAFDNGGAIPVFTKGGRTYSINASEEMIMSLRTAIVSSDAIKLINLDTAGTLTAANEAKYFSVMALDRDFVYNDRVRKTKIRLDIGTVRGFSDLVDTTEESLASEGEGRGRVWVLYYTNTAGQRKYAQYQREEFPFIDVKSQIDESAYYNAYVIEHRSSAQIGVANVSVSPKKAIILIPACDTDTRSNFETILNTWIKSCPSYTLLGDVDSTGDVAVPRPEMCPAPAPPPTP